MAVYEYLQNYGELDYSNYYNGLLSEYASKHEEYKTLFEKCVELNPTVCLYKGFELNINYELISNKKIGYRDASKIPTGTLRVPYILYWKDGETERAILLSTDSYPEAKGTYYCITEPGNTLEPYRMEILALYLNENNTDGIYGYFEKFNSLENSAGYLQRKADNENSSDVESLREECACISNQMFDEVVEKLSSIEDKREKGSIIYRVVGRAFLLKKALYVKYMTSRNLLSDRHSGNQIEQRKFAKSYADEVRIIPFYQLWNGLNAQPKENAD